jgi:hypothetical protein
LRRQCRTTELSTSFRQRVRADEMSPGINNVHSKTGYDSILIPANGWKCESLLPQRDNMRPRIISITVLIVALVSSLLLHYFNRAKMMSTAADTCSQTPSPPCRDGAAPGVFNLLLMAALPQTKLKPET